MSRTQIDPGAIAKQALADGHRVFAWRTATDFSSGAFGRNANEGIVPEVADAIERIEWAGWRLIQVAHSPVTGGTRGRGNMILIFAAGR